MSNLKLLKELGINVSEPVYAREPKCYLTKKVRRNQKVKQNKADYKKADTSLKQDKPLLSKKERKEILRG